MIAHRDLVIGDRSGRPLTIDLLLPRGASEPPPVVVMIHGGGWISGDKTMYADEAPHWVAQGFAVALIEYRLAPLHIFPVQIADVQDAILWLRRNAEEYGFDGRRLAAMGNSAGGHLAAMLGTCDTYYGEEQLDGAFKVEAVVSICGITDLRDPRQNMNPIGWSFLEQFLGSLDDEERNRLASPAAWASRGDASFLILHGDLDDIVPHDQSLLLEKALKANDVAVQRVTLNGEFHSFSFDGWLEIRTRAMRFLRETLGHPGGLKTETSSR